MHLPDHFDLLILLEEAALSVVAVLSELGGQGLGTLLLSTAGLK